MMPYTYYNFWFFPKHMLEYCDRYLLFDNISEHEREVFKETFLKLIKISLWNTKGSQFLSKNPPHTGRVKTLVEMFPNAKFIYLTKSVYGVREHAQLLYQYDPAAPLAGHLQRADRKQFYRSIPPFVL